VGLNAPDVESSEGDESVGGRSDSEDTSGAENSLGALNALGDGSAEMGSSKANKSVEARGDSEAAGEIVSCNADISERPVPNSDPDVPSETRFEVGLSDDEVTFEGSSGRFSVVGTLTPVVATLVVFATDFTALDTEETPAKIASEFALIAAAAATPAAAPAIRSGLTSGNESSGNESRAAPTGIAPTGILFDILVKKENHFFFFLTLGFLFSAPDFESVSGLLFVSGSFGSIFLTP